MGGASFSVTYGWETHATDGVALEWSVQHNVHSPPRHPIPIKIHVKTSYGNKSFDICRTVWWTYHVPCMELWFYAHVQYGSFHSVQSLEMKLTTFIMLLQSGTELVWDRTQIHYLESYVVFSPKLFQAYWKCIVTCASRFLDFEMLFNESEQALVMPLLRYHLS